MVIGGSVLDLSNMIWTEDKSSPQKEGCIYLVMDIENWDLEECKEYAKKYFWIYYADTRIEYGLTSVPHYLALRTEDGRYILEELGPYIKERDGKQIFDLLDLPDKLHGQRLHRSIHLPRTPADRSFNRWRDGFFYAEKTAPTRLWRFVRQRTESGHKGEDHL